MQARLFTLMAVISKVYIYLTSTYQNPLVFLNDQFLYHYPCIKCIHLQVDLLSMDDLFLVLLVDSLKGLSSQILYLHFIGLSKGVEPADHEFVICFSIFFTVCEI